MADTRVADLPDSGLPDDADLLYLVDVSAGPPRDRKLTIANLETVFNIAHPPTLPTGLNVTDYYLSATTTDGVEVSMLPLIPISDESTLLFVAYIVARQAGGSTGTYKLEGSIERTAGVTSPDSAVFRTTFSEDNAAWGVTFEADVVNNALSILVTGALATTLQWFAHVHVVEVTA